MIIILSLVVVMVYYVHQKFFFLCLFSLNEFVCFRDNTLPGLKEDSKHPEMSKRGKLKREVTNFGCHPKRPLKSKTMDQMARSY